MQTALMTWRLNVEIEFLPRSLKSYFRVRWDATKFVLRQDISGNPEAVEWRQRSWHIREREASYLLDDSMLGRSGDRMNDRVNNAGHESYQYSRLQQRMRNLCE